MLSFRHVRDRRGALSGVTSVNACQSIVGSLTMGMQGAVQSPTLPPPRLRSVFLSTFNTVPNPRRNRRHKRRHECCCSIPTICGFRSSQHLNIFRSTRHKFAEIITVDNAHRSAIQPQALDIRSRGYHDVNSTITPSRSDTTVAEGRRR